MKMPDIEANKPETITRYEHELSLWYQEIAYKRAILILCVIVVVMAALAITETVLRHIENRKWLSFLEQYDYVSNETVTVDGETGVANYIGKDGNIYNGEDYGQTDEDQSEKEPHFQQGNPAA